MRLIVHRLEPGELNHELLWLSVSGATRSAIEFFHGHFLSAWKWNPLAFIAYCALSIFDAYAAIALVMRAPRLRIAHFTTGDRTFLRLFSIVLLALNWIYLWSANPPL